MDPLLLIRAYNLNAILFFEDNVLILDLFQLIRKDDFHLLYIRFDVVIEILHEFGLSIHNQDVGVVFVKVQSLAENGLNVETTRRNVVRYGRTCCIFRLILIVLKCLFEHFWKLAEILKLI